MMAGQAPELSRSMSPMCRVWPNPETFSTQKPPRLQNLRQSAPSANGLLADLGRGHETAPYMVTVTFSSLISRANAKGRSLIFTSKSTCSSSGASSTGLSRAITKKYKVPVLPSSIVMCLVPNSRPLRSVTRSKTFCGEELTPNSTMSLCARRTLTPFLLKSPISISREIVGLERQPFEK